MANSFNEVVELFTKAVDSFFATELTSRVFEAGTKFLPITDASFANAGIVKVPAIYTTGLTDYTRANSDWDPTNEYADQSEYEGDALNEHYKNANERDGYRRGSISTKWTMLRPQWNRGARFVVDLCDDMQSNKIITGNATSTFMETQAIPEVDAIRYSKISSYANTSLGNLVAETPSDKNDSSGILHDFHKAFAWQKQFGVPEKDQIIFVNPDIMRTIRNSQELTRFLSADRETIGNVTMGFQRFDGRRIVEVPSDRFLTDVALIHSDEGGYRSTSTSKSINYIVANTRAVVPFQIINKVKLLGPEAAEILGFDGYLMDFHLWHGCYVLPNKVPGIYVSVANSLSQYDAGSLFVALQQGDVDNSYKAISFFTLPQGRFGRLVSSDKALNVGDAFTEGGADNHAYVSLKTDIVEADATQKFFGLVGSMGNIIAVTKTAIQLPKKPAPASSTPSTQSYSARRR